MGAVVEVRQRGLENGREVSRLEAIDIMMSSVHTRVAGSRANFILDGKG